MNFLIRILVSLYAFFFFFGYSQCHLKKIKLDKFVLKTWISRRISYFTGILREV